MNSGQNSHYYAFIHTFSINLLTCVYRTPTVRQILLGVGMREGCSTAPATVHGLVGQTDPLTGSQSVGTQRRKELSLGGPQRPGSGWESISEEGTFKLGLEGKNMNKFLQESFLRGFSQMIGNAYEK